VRQVVEPVVAGEVARASASASVREQTAQLQQAAAELQSTATSQVTVYREQLRIAGDQDRDFRRLTAAWIGRYEREIDDLLDAVASAVKDARLGRPPAKPPFPVLPEGADRFEGVLASIAVARHRVLDALATLGGRDPAVDVPADGDDGLVLNAPARGPKTAETGMDAEAERVGVAGFEQQLRTFAALAARQALEHRRTLQALDVVEDVTEDPDLLELVTHVDHLVTRGLRSAQSLQVLAGGTLPVSSDAVAVPDIAQQAAGEIEEYRRVTIAHPMPEVLVSGYAVSALVHMLAELLENATVFSPGGPDVVVRAERAETGGVVVEVEDAGLHMPEQQLKEVNNLLTGVAPADLRQHLADARLGLLVVALLGQQHGVFVALRPAGTRGTIARLVVPARLLTEQVPPMDPTASAPASSPLAQHHRPSPAVTGSDATVTPLPRRPHAKPPYPARPAAGPVPGPETPGAQQAGAAGVAPQLPRRRPKAREGAAAAPSAIMPPAPPTPGLAGAFFRSPGRQDQPKQQGQQGTSGADGP
jgi:signal transduction histidine kinase